MSQILMDFFGFFQIFSNRSNTVLYKCPYELSSGVYTLMFGNRTRDMFKIQWSSTVEESPRSNLA